MATRPNILCVLTDQQSASTMSCVGNQDLHTPAMDHLAREGVLFEQAYVTQPLCTPCRGSMFTGLMPHQCGTPCNGAAIHAERRPLELGNMLRHSGYECLYGGKWHVPEIRMPENNDHGFRAICGFDDHELAGACVDYFAEFAEGEAGQRQPFFMVASFDNPHNICEYGRTMALPWGDLPEPPPLEQCPNLPANFAVPPFEPELLRLEQACNWAINPYRERSAEDWRRLRWGYFRLVEKVDREIGRILDGLRQHGLEKDTVVIFSSDHGDGHGAHQWNQKSVLYEEVVRVPMIVRAPGGRRGHADAAHLVSNALDLFPTVCDYAGVAPPDDLTGHSLRALVEGHDPSGWRDAVYIETAFDGGRGYGTRGRAVRTQRFKYMVYDRGKFREQLVDLENDPGEMVNLAVESRHREELEHHRELLREFVVEADDNFRVPTSDGSHR